MFGDAHDVVLIGYVDKGNNHRRIVRSPNGATEGSSCDETFTFAKNKYIFPHDEAPDNTSSVVVAKLHEFHVELLPFAPYLTPRDSYLFPHLEDQDLLRMRLTHV